MPDLQSYSVSSALGYTVRWWRIFGWLHNFNSAVECYMEAKTQFTECFCDFAQLSASKTESSNKKMHWNLKPKIATSVTRFYLDLSCGSVFWPNAFRLCFAMRFWVSPLLSSLGQRPCCFSVEYPTTFTCIRGMLIQSWSSTQFAQCMVPDGNQISNLYRPCRIYISNLFCRRQICAPRPWLWQLCCLLFSWTSKCILMPWVATWWHSSPCVCTTHHLKCFCLLTRSSSVQWISAPSTSRPSLSESFWIEFQSTSIDSFFAFTLLMVNSFLEMVGCRWFRSLEKRPRWTPSWDFEGIGTNRYKPIWGNEGNEGSKAFKEPKEPRTWDSRRLKELQIFHLVWMRSAKHHHECEESS